MSSLNGFKVLLMGPAGAGKTHSLGTLVDEGLECFYLGLENGLESLIAYWTDRNLPVPKNLHWHQFPVGVMDLDLLIQGAKNINTLTYKALSQMDDPKKSKHNSFVKLLEAMNSFEDQRTGENFGSVLSWSNERVLMIDGLTGISAAAMSLVIGGSPTAMEGEWGMAMGQIERFVKMCCNATKCHFVLISHIEREMDPVFGGTKISAATLGKKLAPKLPIEFSDVVLAVRNGNKWMWDTANSQADLKIRYLTVAADLQPSFKPIVTKWRKRNDALKEQEMLSNAAPDQAVPLESKPE